ncbi:hypothetical protein PCASD_07969 [Puccinia coronata f. sp. avenae]|uniref:Uncharacterized protein n=1 Tax=Puccinia coronata f. sp. avenae TaxID=200324 RepID=A0A2N5UTG5_9BASI|nr:hypothetical protein PCASD_07969 [Puccinia coronata f. sp. avenae]
MSKLKAGIDGASQASFKVHISRVGRGIENVSSGSDRLDVAPRDHSTCKKSPLTTGAAIISALIQCRPAVPPRHQTTRHRRLTREHAIAGH